MTEKKYPEEIYPKLGFRTDDFGRLTYRTTFNSDCEYAYDLGYRDGRFKERLEASNPRAGWSNLTEAIAAGERIDWDALDGLEARCVHPELGTLTHKLERDICYSETSFNGWYLEPVDLAWENAILEAWEGIGGWSLWVKGDLPLRKQTADELEPGTCFRARFKRNGTEHNYKYAQLVNVTPEKQVVICYSHQLVSIFDWHYAPGEVEAIEVYGIATFPAPKEEA